MVNYRMDRLSQDIKREVSDILLKDIKDPRVQNVTITDVKVTGDLQQATIYYSILSDLASDNQKVAIGLQKVTNMVRKLLGNRLTVYKIPEIEFIKDESVAYGDHIDRLLNEMKQKQ